MSIKIGDKAPDFTLKSHKMESISLSSFENNKNVLILFFPLVNTATCEKELCSTRDGISQYSNLNAEVLAISVDSPFAQKLWAEKHNFNFSLLSDFNKDISKAYGAHYDVFAPGKLDFNGVAKRSAFVVDKNGIVRYSEVLENPNDEPNYDLIKETLESL